MSHAIKKQFSFSEVSYLVGDIFSRDCAIFSMNNRQLGEEKFLNLNTEMY